MNDIVITKIKSEHDIVGRGHVICIDCSENGYDRADFGLETTIRVGDLRYNLIGIEMITHSSVVGLIVKPIVEVPIEMIEHRHKVYEYDEFEIDHEDYRHVRISAFAGRLNEWEYYSSTFNAYCDINDPSIIRKLNIFYKKWKYGL